MAKKTQNKKIEVALSNAKTKTAKTCPKASYLPTKLKATGPGLGEIEISAVKATFDGADLGTFQKKGDARAFVKAARAAWRAANGGQSVLQKTDKRVKSILGRVQGAIARGKGLPEDVLDSLKIIAADMFELTEKINKVE